MKTNNRFSRIRRMVLVACFAVISQTIVFAQPFVISANVSNAQPSANEEIELTLSISDDLDFYYGGVEVTFPENLIEFTGIENTGLSDGGIQSYGEISAGTIGVSVSRTTALSAPSQGNFMKLIFRVKGSTLAETADISFTEQELTDSEGNELQTDPISPLSLDIQESIGQLGLTIPRTNEITEGDNFHATGKLFATGVTEVSRINAWAGISSNDTDPSTWPESAWQIMAHQSTDASDNLEYSSEVAQQRAVGTWYIALRAKLDDGSYVYGGLDSLWDASSSPNAQLTIKQQPPHRYKLAEWNFDNETLTTSTAIPDNHDAKLELTGASLEGFSDGASGEAVNSNGWDGEEDSKYWSVIISTAGFSSIELSSKQYGSNTGPRDFIIEISTDGSTWEQVDEGEIQVGHNWSDGILGNLALPKNTENQENLHIRWVKSSNIPINSDDVGSSGTNRIDDILITGINESAQRVDVYPGDANNDGQVNSDDVLPLGTYWLRQGPSPVYKTTAFEAREVEEWIPAEATYADTRGDGEVNHEDLLPIGLHFGKSIASEKKNFRQPLEEMVLGPLPGDSVISFSLETNLENEMRGLSFSLSVKGTSPEKWIIQNVTPEFCPKKWENNLLNFEIQHKETFESAFVLKGKEDITYSSDLVTFDLKATEEWNTSATLSVNRVTVSNSISNKEPLNSLNLIPTGQGNGLSDYKEKLLPIRPNPFTEQTIIPYELSTRTHVRLEILNLQGRPISTLVEKVQDAGNYSIRFNARNLHGGVYICRMKTGTGYVRCRKMALVK